MASDRHMEAAREIERIAILRGGTPIIAEIVQALADAERAGLERAAQIVRDSRFKIGGIYADNIADVILSQAGEDA